MKHIDRVLIYTTILTGRKYYETSHYLLRTYHTYAPLAKSYGVAVLHRVRRAVILAAEWYDTKRPKETECSGDLLCERSGKRHKDGCIGRVEPFNSYVRGLQ
jgi:hypothetical protein